jgi:hypothetical protein
MNENMIFPNCVQKSKGELEFYKEARFICKE